MLGSRISFSALVCPAGVHVVAYSQSRAGLRIERYNRDLRDSLAEEEAAQVLGDLLEAEGGRGRSVSIAVTGFGSSHQILTLPPAAPEHLRPIVTRELRRFYPNLFDPGTAEPVVEFVELHSPHGSAPGPHKELLVAAVPQEFLRTVAHALEARHIHLDHWTILPRAVQRLFDAFADSTSTAAALLMVPKWPLLGFFHQHELRLFSEPSSAPGKGTESEWEAVGEHLDRGAIFLRQQFRGAGVSHLLVATEPGGSAAALAGELGERAGLTVEPLGPPGEAPGALAALGAALDARAPDGLNLLPLDLRPPSRTDRWVRALGVASAAMVLIAALWWSSSGLRVEAQTARELTILADELGRRSDQIAAIRPIVDERQAHAQRAALLNLLTRDRRRLPEILWPLQAAAPAVEVRTLDMKREEKGWRVVLGVRAAGRSAAEATDALNALYHQLGAELPQDALSMGGLALDRLTPADSTSTQPGTVPIAASAELTFIVPAPNAPVR